MKLFKLRLPEGARKIIQVLNQNGYQAYAVGGCVRDSIIGRVPNDWDIATDALPSRIKELFPRTVDTGIKHGTVTVLTEEGSFEVTTYRIDGIYTDNRRPESVTFTSSLEEDLSRRDFTINAIAYHPDEGFVDPFNGIEDISRKIIMTVGDASSRFQEDALRMLRAVRFSAQLGFDVHDSVIKSIKDNNELIRNISYERIRDELTKILVSKRPLRFALLHDTGLLSHIIPEFEACFSTWQNSPCHIYDVAMHTLKAVSYISDKSTLRWAMLLHDIGKPLTKTSDDRNIDHFDGHHHVSASMAKKILKRLKFDNKSLEYICRLIEHHEITIEPTPAAVRKAVNLTGADAFHDVLEVQGADIKAQNPAFLEERMKKLMEIRRLYDEIRASGQCISLQQLAVNGRDLIESGFEPGKEIGRVLDYLLDKVLEDPELNSKQKLLELADRLRTCR